MREEFVPKVFRAGSLEIIEQANEIIEAYQAQGFTLTLRQLYYQFVSRDLIANKQSEYKRLGSIINDARLAGLIDWGAIEDRGRVVREQARWEDPSDAVAAIADQYREDLWIGQPRRVVVRVEKDALLGVIEPACHRWRTPFIGCRGYSSQSEQYEAGQTYARWLDEGQVPLVLYLGDHDPSGIDMTRDTRERLSMFAYDEIEVRRLALNFDQVSRYNLPPNPAKDTDSRATSYIAAFGVSSWELDALEPTVIDRLIDREIQDVVDLEVWAAAVEIEEDNKAKLARVSERWADVEALVT